MSYHVLWDPRASGHVLVILITHACARTHIHTHNGICFDSCQCPSLLVTTCLQEVRWHLLPLHPSPVTVTQTSHQWPTTDNYTCLKWSSCKGQQGTFFLRTPLRETGMKHSFPGNFTSSNSKQTYLQLWCALTDISPSSWNPIRDCRKVVSHCEDSKSPQDTRPDPNPVKDTKGWCRLYTRRPASCIQATTVNNRLQPNSPIKEQIGTDSLQRYI